MRANARGWRSQPFGGECEAGRPTTLDDHYIQIKWNQKMRFGGELPGPGFSASQIPQTPRIGSPVSI